MKSRISCGALNRKEVAVELAKLFAAFPAQEQSGGTLDLRMEAYFEALHGIPAWAVQEARLRVIRGEVSTLNPTFSPTPPEFAAAARRIMEPVRGDLARLQAIEAAAKDSDPSSEERGRVVAQMDALRAEMTRGPTQQENRAADEAALRKRLRDLGHPESALDEVPNA